MRVRVLPLACVVRKAVRYRVACFVCVLGLCGAAAFGVSRCMFRECTRACGPPHAGHCIFRVCTRACGAAACGALYVSRVYTGLWAAACGALYVSHVYTGLWGRRMRGVVCFACVHGLVGPPCADVHFIFFYGSRTRRALAALAMSMDGKRHRPAGVVTKQCVGAAAGAAEGHDARAKVEHDTEGDIGDVGGGGGGGGGDGGGGGGGGAEVESDGSDDAAADDVVRGSGSGAAPRSDVMLTARATTTRIGATFQADLPPLCTKPRAGTAAPAGVGGMLVWAPLTNPSDESRIIGGTMAEVWGLFNHSRLKRRATPLAAPDPSHGGALCRAYQVDAPEAPGAAATMSADTVRVIFEGSAKPTTVAWADIRMARCVRQSLWQRNVWQHGSDLSGDAQLHARVVSCVCRSGHLDPLVLTEELVLEVILKKSYDGPGAVHRIASMLGAASGSAPATTYEYHQIRTPWNIQRANIFSEEANRCVRVYVCVLCVSVCVFACVPACACACVGVSVCCETLL
jgi:hypothetical protein